MPPGCTLDVRTPRDELAKAAAEVGIAVDGGLGAGQDAARDLREDDRSRAVGPGVRHATIRPRSRRWPGAHRDGPELVERYEPVVAGRELGNGFSELIDPDDQRARFEEQAAKATRPATRRSPVRSTRSTPGARVRAAPDFGLRARGRPAGDAPGRCGQHPRGHRLPDAAARSGLTAAGQGTVPGARGRFGGSLTLFRLSLRFRAFPEILHDESLTSGAQPGWCRRVAGECAVCTESKEDIMFRKIIAGTAVAGALTFGAAGIAGAATPTTPTGVDTRPPCAPSSRALQAKVQARRGQGQRLGAQGPGP